MRLRDQCAGWLEGLRDRYGRKRVNALITLAIVGLASLSIQLLIRYDYDHTAMLYLAVPYAVAVLITLLRPYRPRKTLSREYVSHSATALVVFLASSVILFEGFICVLFFMPIYFLIVTLVFSVQRRSASRAGRANKTYSTTVPLLIALLSLEGVSEVTTLDRVNRVTATATTTASPAELLRNLAEPFELPSSDDWMLGLFPMPHTIEAGSLQPGDIHRVHMRYHRWFFTNTHEGVIELRIDSVTPRRITTSFIRDTSYFSTYVTMIGGEIEFTTGEHGATHISLTLDYERRLDPAWYFQPIQQHAIKAMAAHFIQEVMIRDKPEQDDPRGVAPSS